MSSSSCGASHDSPVLETRGLTRWYGSFAALKGIDVEFTRGEVHGLCGENGAGKSTFVKILGGLVAPTEGQVIVDGTPLKPGRRTDPRAISIVHQELSIVPDLSVLDNVLLGDDRVGEWLARGRYRAEVRDGLDAIGLAHIDLEQPARTLTLAERQLVEIARGVSRKARILILDEPTATLSDNEIQRVFAAVRWLRDQGSTIVFISHRLPEVFALTDRVTVFRNGSKILTRRTAELGVDELVKAMIGRTVARHDSAERPRVVSGPVRLELAGLQVPGRTLPADLSVAAGEIVAVVGQLGSGADALVEALAGQCRTYGGSVRIDGESVALRTPREAIAAGVSYVAEDRAGKGVFLDAPIEANISASILQRLKRFGWLSRVAERHRTHSLAEQFTIDPSRLPHEVETLSGGNQQKVAIAKAVAIEPKVLVLNEPTRGVDIGARTEIYRQLRVLAESGVTIVFFSTDLEEVLELADRVVTVFRGSIVNDRTIEYVDMDTLLEDILQGPHALAERAA